MKIAFYLDSRKNNINYGDPTVANPGIGGTQFLIWTISYYLKYYFDEYEIILFCENIKDFPDRILSYSVKDSIDCIYRCSQLEVDYLILRGPFLKRTEYEAIEYCHVHTILWSHNFENYPMINRASRCPYIVKNICVSYEQRELLRDTALYNKSVTIFNALNFEPFMNVSIEPVPYRICYVGNLYPSSGYETLIKNWEGIEKKYPQAELYIIGGNELYDVKKMSSCYSKRSFEKIRNLERKYFYDVNGHLKSNIHFVGILGGKDKLELMASAYVGIANITLAGETFGLSAVEFEALGVPVVSINRYGVRDVVKDKDTGILVSKKHEIDNAVCKIIGNKSLHDEMAERSKDFVRNKFSIDIIIHEWKRLFDNVEKFASEERNSAYYLYDLKLFVWINAKVKEITHINGLLPMAFYKYLAYGFRRVIQKLNLF